MPKIACVVSRSFVLAALLPACWHVGQGFAPPDGGGADSDADTDTDTDIDTDTDPCCAELSWDAALAPVNVLLLLDRSYSMFDSMIGDATYAELVAMVLGDLVAANEGTGLVNFGLAVFPSLACPPGGGAGPDEECHPASDDPDPELDAPEVEIGGDNVDELVAALDAVGQCGGTPLCGSMEWALSYLSDLPEELAGLATYVLVATDGAPNCNPDADVSTCEPSSGSGDVEYPEQCLDDACAYGAAQALYAAGFGLFLAGVGDAAVFAEVMQGIAYYGGGGLLPEDEIPATPQLWYSAMEPDSLQSALDGIVGQTAVCAFAVPWDEIPDACPDPPYDPIEKACDRVNVFGVIADSEDEIELVYSPDCADEDPDSSVYAWQWQGIDAPVDELDEYALGECDVIELCPGACAMLGDGAWSGVVAYVGFVTAGP